MRLTAGRRRAIEEALLALGIEVSPPLDQADLDDLVSLRPLPGLRRGADRWSRARTALAVLGWVLALAGGITAIATLVSWVWPGGRPSHQLTGEFNIAVADFRGQGSTGTGEEARRLSRSLTTSLDALGSHASPRALQIDVAGPNDVGKVAENRALRAIDRHGADLLVNGILISDAVHTDFRVSLHMNGKRLRGAEELRGLTGHRILLPGSIMSNPVTQRDLRLQLLDHVKTVQRMIVGVGYLVQHRFKEAEQELGSAQQGWGTRGSEVVLLLLGHAAAQQRKLTEADRHYRAALHVRPRYLRARFALSELSFQRASGACSRGSVNRPQMKSAAEGFRTVRADATGALRTKAVFALARLDVCLTQARLTRRFREAQEGFISVIRRYEQAPGATAILVRDEAAESYGWLGFLALPERGRRQPVAGLVARAAHYYRRAADLTTQPSRRRFFRRMRRRAIRKSAPRSPSPREASRRR